MRHTHLVHRSLWVVGLVAGIALALVGAWQVYESNTLIGALAVALGAVIYSLAIAVKNREPGEGWSGVLDTFAAFISRGP